MTLLKTQGKDKMMNINAFIHPGYKAEKLKVFVALKLTNLNIQALAN